jgi:tol-pal system-associated acyl-CoA thioesterase
VDVSDRSPRRRTPHPRAEAPFVNTNTSMQIPKEGRIKVKVYYEDTDSLGVVYYANYLRYFERGRSELFAAGGVPIAEWNRLGFYVAVYQANITFRAPARLGEELEVVTRRLAGGSAYRVKLQQQVVRDEKVITEAEIHLVCLDESFELREFPAAMVGEP